MVMVAALQLGPPMPLNPTEPEVTYLVVEPPAVLVPAPVTVAAPRPRRQPALAQPRRAATKLALPPRRPAVPTRPGRSPTPGARPAPVLAPPRSDPPPPKPAVQLGGFGDPAGADPPPQPKLPVNLPQLGSFGRAAAGDPALPSDPPVHAAGFGATTGAQAAGGGGDGSDVHTGGFGAAEPSAGHAAGGAAPSMLHLNAFAAPPSNPSGRRATAAAVPAFEPPQILSWPRPAYTAAALAHKIEGEVTLQVLLRADGGVEVQRVVRGLGYGLEQSAMAAAAAVRFRPARRNGEAVDWAVLMHIRFQLAY